MCKGKVSIIVPVYNSEKYIEACIQSVLRQTYTNWELILVNDGSTDTSETICRSYAEADDRIVLISQKNRGVSGARNTGIEKASGAYFSFVDSDDELEKNALECMVQDIIAYNADMVSATKRRVFSDGREQINRNDGTVFVYEGDEMLKRSLAYEDETRALHAKLISRDLIGETRFIDGHNINEDGYFLFECFQKKPKVVQRYVSAYVYYIRDGSASNSKFSDKYLDMLFFCDLKMEYIRTHMPELLDDAKNMAVRTNLLFLQVLCRTTDKKYRETQKRCVKTVRDWRSHYKPINKHHRKLAWLVAHGLYPAYRWLIGVMYF